MRARVLQFPRAADRLAQRNKLVEDHAHIVGPIASGIHRHRPPSFDLADLVGIGNLALVQAAESYNPSTGVPFEAWARFKVRTAIVDGTRRKAYRDSTHEGLDPWHSEMRDQRPNVEETLVAETKVQTIRECVEQLPERMRTVVIARYVEGQTLGVISRKKAGYTSRAVTELHRGALRLVRAELEDRGVVEPEPPPTTPCQIMAFVRQAA